jgi:hypothetical protein
LFTADPRFFFLTMTSTTTRPAFSRPATTRPATGRPATASPANGPGPIRRDPASANGSNSNGTRATGTSADGTSAGPTALHLIRQLCATDATAGAASGHATGPEPRPHPSSAATHLPGFSAEQRAALAAPLNRALVSSREQGRSQVSYLQSWVVINEANRIFGFDGWQRQTIAVRCVAQSERLIGAKGTNREQKPGWGVTYTARVRIIVLAGGLLPLIREGSGAGHGIDTDLGLAHESALKEAETDAMKRALMTFGNPFGLALYDKSQRQVSGNGQVQSQGQWQGQAPSQARSAPQGQAPGRPHSPSHVPGPSPVPAAQRQPSTSPPAQRLSPLANPVAAAFNGPARSQGSNGNGATSSYGTRNGQANGAQNPTAGAATPAATARPQAAPTSAPAARTAATTRLDPATIEALQKRLRALLPPQLAAFSRAFRSVFQVPDATPSISGLITEQRHLAWIQRYLTQTQGQSHSHSQSQGHSQARAA